MKAELDWLKGMNFVAKSEGGHRVVMDTQVESGGEASAPSPMEYQLMALLGCTAMDVVPILEKMKVPFSRFQIFAEAQRASEHPRVLTSVNLLFRLHAKKDAEPSLRRAVELSQTKYCSVSAMIAKTAKIEYSVEVVDDSTAV